MGDDARPFRVHLRDGLLAFPILIAGALCFGVGIIPAVIWIRSAFASMYFAVSQGVTARSAESESSAASA